MFGDTGSYLTKDILIDDDNYIDYGDSDGKSNIVLCVGLFVTTLSLIMIQLYF